jgi:hypothetical protein
MPRHRQNERRAVKENRVRDDVVAPTALCTWHALLVGTRREDLLVVPLPSRVLPKMHDEPVDLEKTEQRSLVDEIARVPAHRKAAQCHEQRVVRSANLGRVDRGTAERESGDPPDVELPLHLRRDEPRDVVAGEVPSELRLEHTGHNDRDEQPEAEQRHGAGEDDESAASHADSALRTPGRSRPGSSVASGSSNPLAAGTMSGTPSSVPAVPASR